MTNSQYLLNVLCGVWVLLAPWFIEGDTPWL